MIIRVFLNPEVSEQLFYLINLINLFNCPQIPGIDGVKGYPFGFSGDHDHELLYSWAHSFAAFLSCIAAASTRYTFTLTNVFGRGYNAYIFGLGRSVDFGGVENREYQINFFSVCSIIRIRIVLLVEGE